MMENTWRNLFRILCLGLATVLAGCGGGGSSGNADGGDAGKQEVVPLAQIRSPITGKNFTYVSASSYIALESIAEVAEGIGVTAAAFPGALELPGQSGGDRDPGSAAVPSLGAVMNTAGFQLVAGVPQKFNCALGGSITFSGVMANQNRLTKGDEVNIIAENCRRPDDPTDVDGDLINGAISLSVREMNGTPGPDSVWSGTIAVRYDKLVTVSDTGTESLNGDMDVNVSQSATENQVLAATGKELRLSQQATGKSALELVLRDYRIDARKSGDDLSFGGNFDLSATTPGAGTFLVGVSTGKPFTVNLDDAMPIAPADGAPPGDGIVQVDVYPSSGQMTMTGAASNATLEAERTNEQDRRFIARLTVEGTSSDGFFSASQSMLWKDLMSEL